MKRTDTDVVTKITNVKRISHKSRKWKGFYHRKITDIGTHLTILTLYDISFFWESFSDLELHNNGSPTVFLISRN